MPDIHEELHRLILRKRWIVWSRRNYKPGDYDFPQAGRHQVLSRRLSAWKPTWEWRHKDQAVEDELR